jgi:hypothetical protein
LARNHPVGDPQITSLLLLMLLLPALEVRETRSMEAK